MGRVGVRQVAGVELPDALEPVHVGGTDLVEG
jgi:hypothetical protein